MGVELGRAAARRRADRFRRLAERKFDVVVVGAGMGGLMAAALLARRGRSVLIVDRHYVAGGNATVFHRPGYEFDVGVHYVGQGGPDGFFERMLSAAGVTDVSFAQMDPDGFDTLVFPDFEFRVPAGIDRYRDRMLEMFPAERRGIDRYARLLHQVARMARSMGDPAKIAWTVLTNPSLPFRANATLGSFLDETIRDPRLRALIAAESGDYAEPPSRASLLLHAGLMAHYLDGGAYYPKGGGQIMADKLAESIEAAGGKILLSTRVLKILVENGRACGIELENKHLGRVSVRADVVISNADLKRTLLELLPAEALSRRTRERTRDYEMAPALGIAYLGVRASAFEGRTRNTNYWLHPEYDSERPYSDVRAGRFSERPFVFISIASFKDPLNARNAPPGIVNIELMTLAPSAPEAWGVSQDSFARGDYSDNETYRRAKDELARRLIAESERIFPGLSDAIEYVEVATPLTHSRYTLSTGGTSYGIALVPGQFLHRRPGPTTELPGLVLAGASMRTGHGIFGSMSSGVMAASAVLGSNVVKEAFGARTRASLSLPEPAPA